MKATITVNMDNAAFEPDNGQELARILRRLAGWIEGVRRVSPDESQGLRDVNGNTVGQFTITEEE